MAARKGFRNTVLNTALVLLFWSQAGFACATCFSVPDQDRTAVALSMVVLLVAVLSIQVVLARGLLRLLRRGGGATGLEASEG